MEPVVRAGVVGKLRGAYQAAMGTEEKGGYLHKALWPLFGAVAAAPVIGYEADKLKARQQEGTAKMSAHRVVNAASMDVLAALLGGTKLAALNTLKIEIDRAKRRAGKQTSSEGRLSEEGDQEGRVATDNLSANPDFRP